MNTLLYLASPLVLLAGGVFFLLLDMVYEGRNRSIAYSVMTIVVLIISLGAVVLLPAHEDTQVLQMLEYDDLTRVFWLIAHVTLMAVVVIGKDYVDESIQERGLYYSFYLFSALGMELLMASTNILMLFLSMDFLSVLTYVLTGYQRNSIRSAEAATKYLVYGAVLSALMALGLSWLYGLTGTTDYARIAAVLGGLEPWPVETAINATTLLPVLVFVAAGLAFKVAAAPFHQWAPDAYDGAPISVTAFLAVLPKLAGLGAFMRISMVMFPLDTDLGNTWHVQILVFMALFSMTFGNLAGLWQNSLKRLMAYSSIAQIGYILLGIAIGTQHGYRSTLFFMMAYVLADLAVFAVILTMPQQDAHINDLRGLLNRRPFLAVVFIWAVLSLTGIPGTAGFFAKFTLITAGLESAQPWIVVVVVINTVISVGYYWRLLHAAFTAPEKDSTLSTPDQDDAKLSTHSYIVPAVAALGIAVLGILPAVVLAMINQALLFIK